MTVACGTLITEVVFVFYEFKHISHYILYIKIMYSIVQFMNGQCYITEEYLY